MTSSSIQPVSVLVVDDSAIIRSRLRALLAEDDCIRWVGEAGTCAEAWTLFGQVRPEAVLLDLHLPDGNGLGLLSRIKKAAPSCLLIVLTNCREAIFQHESRRCGADHFLHKATQFEQVAVLLHRYAIQRPPREFVHQTIVQP